MISRRKLAILLFLAVLPVAAQARDVPFVRDVFNRINGQRKQHRLSTLPYNKTLEKSAQAHAEWMARERKMDHLQPAPASFEGTQGRPTPRTKERRVAYCPRFFAYSA
jgi:hypothetical protein